MHCDCLIIGGGVIGLSLAWELAQAGARVRLIDRSQIGQEASWAGAGMLPPGSMAEQATSIDRLHFLSGKYHADWSTKLRELTGIDNGYRPCGAIYLGQPGSSGVNLPEQWRTWRELGIEAEVLTAESLTRIEPVLGGDWVSKEAELPTACFVPREAQIRNPRHLKALRSACLLSGVEISPGVEAEDFLVRDRRVTGVLANGQPIHTDQVCLTTGSWSTALASRLGIRLAVRPVRGQIALLEQPACQLKRIINVGPKYLVPRGDGLILIGATMEEAGFDRRTTVEGIRGLLDFACQILPELAEANLARSWAGLRPATADQLPYMGKLPGLDNAFMSTGHFRAGLCLSPASAVVLRQIMQGEPPEIDVADFQVDRDE